MCNVQATCLHFRSSTLLSLGCAINVSEINNGINHGEQLRCPCASFAAAAVVNNINYAAALDTLHPFANGQRRVY